MTDPQAPGYEHPQQQTYPESTSGGARPYGTGGAQPSAYESYEPSPPRGLSITSFVLGVISVVTWFSVVVPLAGLVIGVLALKREPAGRGLAITGIVLNGLFIVIALLAVVVVVLLTIGLVGLLPVFLQDASTGLAA